MKPTINTRFIPSDTEEKQFTNLNAVVYVADNYAIAYSGKKTNPDFHYRFKSNEQRDSYINKWIDNLKGKQQNKLAMKQTRNQPHTLQIGDIMIHSWGYEQTNVDFYQVISKTEKTVKLQAIGQQVVKGSEGFMCCNVIPIKNNFVNDKIITKKADKDNYVSMEFGCMLKWDGKPHYMSWYA